MKLMEVSIWGSQCNSQKNIFFAKFFDLFFQIIISGENRCVWDDAQIKNSFIFNLMFLVTTKRLYRRVCLSVGPSVLRMVRRSVGDQLFFPAATYALLVSLHMYLASFTK